MLKKVLLGMSGGVDSSVSAIILKKDYEVIGCTLNLISDKENIDAKEVCNKLGIKYISLNYINEFKKDVIDYFIDEYRSCRTPNPCVMCNKKVKFKYLYDYIKKNDIDYIATGHYAKIIDGMLYKAFDKNKDQSYFLAYVNKDIFKKVLFPLQDMVKTDVRKIAIENDLITARKKDSTGICFIGERNFTKFLKNYLPNQSGDIIDYETKEVLGKHNGLMYYTIGQRKGLNLGGASDKIFVVDKDLENNILYVCSGDENKYLYSTEAIIEEFNFLSNKRVEKCTCKFRYRQQDIECNVTYLDNNEIKVNYKNAKAVTPGQFCVLYLGDECLGGGIIKEVHK